jgi:hypothetical protein
MVVVAIFESSTRDGVNGGGVGGLRNSHIRRSGGKRRCRHPDSTIQSEHEELTHTASSVVSRSSPSSADSSVVVRSESSSVAIDLPEERSSVFYIIRSPELLEHAKSAQCLGFCLFKHMLFVPEPACSRNARARRYALLTACDLARST